MTSSNSDSADVANVINTLRRKGDEAQVTQIIAAFCAADRRFASQLAEVFIEAAPSTTGRKHLGPLPSELTCVAEHQVFDESQDLGRVDLAFFSDEDDFQLFVELKIHSGYGHQQLERYAAALAAFPKDRQALLAITRGFPTYGETQVASSETWLGSIRWPHIYPRLTRLHHKDHFLQELWRHLLTLIRQQGDFGLMDFDPQAAIGWSRYQEGRYILTEMLEEIYEPTLDMIRRALAARQGVAPSHELATAILHNDKRLVWPWADSLNIQIAAPATNGERLRLQFGGGRPDPVFTLEARHDNKNIHLSPDPALAAATKKLQSKGFVTGHYWGAYWSRPHPTDEWLYKGADATTALIELARTDIRDLVESGILEALPTSNASPPTGPATYGDEGTSASP